MEGACNTYLGLGLGQYDPSLKLNPSSSTSRFSPKILQPSLTLGFSDGRRPPSPRSPNSSFSTANQSKVKRETDSVTKDAERVSSRTSDENDEGSTWKKLRLTKEQSALLEDKFKEHATLNTKQKQALAKELNLRPRQVEVWFQNRRARTKFKQTEVDCEVLKKYCETLSHENRRLKKELDELKALKFAPQQVYMQIPALPTVTVCPSCEKVTGASEGRPFVVAPKVQFLSPFAHSAAC